MSETIALYARVSTESQTRDNSIASQIAALQERIAADGLQLEPDHAYVDEGYSGASLLRPALERLRDAAAAGLLDRLYVLAPDRLSRRYAHQVLLIDEFRRAGADVVFLNRPIGGTPEDDLLLQVQGVIAEYERARILERSRRGRRHAARSGLVSAFTGAPFGYRYVPRDQGGGCARFEVVEDEARVVRQIFAWIACDRLSLREVCRRLDQAGCPRRHGAARWYASTIRGMLANPAYTGRAVYGRSRYLPPKPRLRPLRGHPQPSARATSRMPAPPEDWIEVPVPRLVDDELFEAAQAQLAENRKYKRERCCGQRWLLQGLTVCRCCGYAYYGKALLRCSRDRSKGQLRYYRCVGSDGYRFGGTAVCSNHAVRADRLEALVWEQVRQVLSDPHCVAAEYRRRLTQAHDGTAPDEVTRLDHQIASLQRGIGRLIDSYADGVISRAEFEPRIRGLKARVARLEEQRQMVLEAAQAEHDLSLLIGRLEDFAAKVQEGLDHLDWLGQRDIIRTIVRRVEISHDSTEVVFRVPPPDLPHPAGLKRGRTTTCQHCTDGGRTDLRLGHALSASGARLRALT
jgi:site-specific DNA recombinase